MFSDKFVIFFSFNLVRTIPAALNPSKSNCDNSYDDVNRLLSYIVCE